MNKAELLKKIIEKLGESMGALEKAARAAHTEATHESSKAENKYDTRGLEAAYLAGGQARHARETLSSIQAFESMKPTDFAPDTPIDLGALVEVEMDRTSSSFFIGPRSGGLEVEHDGVEVTVITPQSPLGQQLMGRKAGARWTAVAAGPTIRYRIVKVA
jgi:transcription elongation GreA/GreB family factor